MLNGLKVLGALALGFVVSHGARTTSAQNPSGSTKPVLVKEINLNAKVAEAQAFPITVTEKGKEWIEKQKDVYKKTIASNNGGLIDASTFLSDSGKEKLNNLSGQEGKVGDVKLAFKKLESIENGYKYVLDIDYGENNTERWYLSEPPYYKDQFPNGLPYEYIEFAIWKKDGNGAVDRLTQNILLYKDLMTYSNNVNFSYVLDKVKQAKENRKKEIEDPTKIRNFNLPKNEQIGYIGLYDPDPDDVISAGTLDDVKYFPEMMSSLGYKMVSNEEGKYAFGVSDTQPETIIENQIKEFLKRGVKNIYIKLDCHGNEYGAYFPGGVLTPRELMTIFDKYQECNFYISTVACRGAGFADALKRYNDPTGKEGRIVVFLQSKIYALNQEGRLKGIEGVRGAPKIFSSYYDVFLANYLINGRNYGEAHLLADQDAKKLVPCDAEVWKSGPRGGASTTRFLATLNARIN